MKIEPKFDVDKATLDHVWLGTDGACNDVFIVQVIDRENGTERFVWPGESLDRPARPVTDMVPNVRKFLNWCREALLKAEKVFVVASASNVADDTGMTVDDAKKAMVQVSKLQNVPGREGDGDWMEWHDPDGWEADIYPQILVEFLWTLPKKEGLTDDDVAAIDRFQHDLVEFIVSHAIGGVDKTEDDIRWLVDRAEFAGPLADMVCEFCADRGIDIHYPEQVTDTITGDQTVHQCAEPNNYSERSKWLDLLNERDEAKGD